MKKTHMSLFLFTVFCGSFLFSQELQISPRKTFSVVVEEMGYDSPVSVSEVGSRVKLRLRNNGVPYATEDSSLAKDGFLYININVMPHLYETDRRKTGSYSFYVKIAYRRPVFAYDTSRIWVSVWEDGSLGFSPTSTGVRKLVFEKNDSFVDSFSIKFLEENNL